MRIFYSAATRGFYNTAVHGDNMPSDAKEISAQAYLSCLGKAIEPDDQGMPRVVGSAPPTVAEKRERLKTAVAQKRWEVETSGITLPNGLRLDTAREDQGAVAEAIAVWPTMPQLETVSFKAASGFVVLTFEELKQIAAAIGMHKQVCYATEHAHLIAIDALPDAELDSYDFTTGWPE